MTLPAAASGNRFAQRLFAPLPARYDRLAEILSMGQNGRWRRAMVGQVAPAAGKTVLDVASGTAGVALQLADRTDARIVGVDLTEQMLRQGQANVAEVVRADRVQLVLLPIAGVLSLTALAGLLCVLALVAGVVLVAVLLFRPRARIDVVQRKWW